MFTDDALNYLLAFILGGVLVALLCWAYIAELSLKVTTAEIRESILQRQYEVLQHRASMLQAENQQIKNNKTIQLAVRRPNLN